MKAYIYLANLMLCNLESIRCFSNSETTENLIILAVTSSYGLINECCSSHIQRLSRGGCDYPSHAQRDSQRFPSTFPLSPAQHFTRDVPYEILSFYPFTATLFLFYSTTVSLRNGFILSRVPRQIASPVTAQILHITKPFRNIGRDKKEERRAKPHKRDPTRTDLWFSTVIIGNVWCAGSHCWAVRVLLWICRLNSCMLGLVS